MNREYQEAVKALEICTGFLDTAAELLEVQQENFNCGEIDLYEMRDSLIRIAGWLNGDWDFIVSHLDDVDANFYALVLAGKSALDLMAELVDDEVHLIRKFQRFRSDVKKLTSNRSIQQTERAESIIDDAIEKVIDAIDMAKDRLDECIDALYD